MRINLMWCGVLLVREFRRDSQTRQVRWPFLAFDLGGTEKKRRVGNM